MSLAKIDREEFLFIKYDYETIADQDTLKKELAAESSSGRRRDTVLGFTSASVIYSVEIGIIVQFLKTLPGTGRFLRLVVSNYVCEMLITMNIHRIPNLILYNNMEAVQEHYIGVDFGALTSK